MKIGGVGGGYVARSSGRLFIGLTVLLIALFMLSLTKGVVDVSLTEFVHALPGMSGGASLDQAGEILWVIRLPRALTAVAVGVVMAVAGAAAQGLFRNPLADPGLVGISGGSALGAALAIMLLPGFVVEMPMVAPYLTALCAFGGGILVTWVIYCLGRSDGQTRVATLLLAGIAFTTLSGACIGLLTYIFDDTALRSLIFWNLGSLSEMDYARLLPLVLVTFLVVGWLWRRASGLNALLLGEAEAFHLGFDVRRLKRELIGCIALGVGTAVATVGMIGFVGLIVPHLARLCVGPDHHQLLPVAALIGAVLVLSADLAARLVLAPAELPIGIIMALLGAPFFMVLLLRRSM